MPLSISSPFAKIHRCPVLSADLVSNRIAELELLIMLALLRLGDDAYGVSIRQEIEQRSGHSVAIGAVYATLARLEEKRFATSRLSDPLPMRGGRARKHWKLTALGERAVRNAATSLAGMLDGLGLTPQPRRS
jgi:DNA-binding PadR family transcriptional regulator